MKKYIKNRHRNSDYCSFWLFCMRILIKTHIYMTEMQIRQHLSVQECFWKEKR